MLRNLDRMDWAMIAIMAGCVLLVPALLTFGWVEGDRWETFKTEHRCKIVEVQRSTTSIGIGFSGNGTTVVMPITNPGRTGWACDDGVTYWR